MPPGPRTPNGPPSPAGEKEPRVLLDKHFKVEGGISIANIDAVSDRVVKILRERDVPESEISEILDNDILIAHGSEQSLREALLEVVQKYISPTLPTADEPISSAVQEVHGSESVVDTENATTESESIELSFEDHADRKTFFRKVLQLRMNVFKVRQALGIEHHNSRLPNNLLDGYASFMRNYDELKGIMRKIESSLKPDEPGGPIPAVSEVDVARVQELYGRLNEHHKRVMQFAEKNGIEFEYVEEADAESELRSAGTTESESTGEAVSTAEVNPTTNNDAAEHVAAETQADKHALYDAYKSRSLAAVKIGSGYKSLKAVRKEVQDFFPDAANKTLVYKTLDPIFTKISQCIAEKKAAGLEQKDEFQKRIEGLYSEVVDAIANILEATEGYPFAQSENQKSQASGSQESSQANGASEESLLRALMAAQELGGSSSIGEIRDWLVEQDNIDELAYNSVLLPTLVAMFVASGIYAHEQAEQRATERIEKSIGEVIKTVSDPAERKKEINKILTHFEVDIKNNETISTDPRQTDEAGGNEIILTSSELQDHIKNATIDDEYGITIITSVVAQLEGIGYTNQEATSRTRSALTQIDLDSPTARRDIELAVHSIITKAQHDNTESSLKANVAKKVVRKYSASEIDYDPKDVERGKKTQSDLTFLESLERSYRSNTENYLKHQAQNPMIAAAMAETGKILQEQLEAVRSGHQLTDEEQSALKDTLLNYKKFLKGEPTVTPSARDTVENDPAENIEPSTSKIATYEWREGKSEFQGDEAYRKNIEDSLDEVLRNLPDYSAEGLAMYTGELPTRVEEINRRITERITIVKNLLTETEEVGGMYGAAIHVSYSEEQKLKIKDVIDEIVELCTQLHTLTVQQKPEEANDTATPQLLVDTYKQERNELIHAKREEYIAIKHRMIAAEAAYFEALRQENVNRSWRLGIRSSGDDEVSNKAYTEYVEAKSAYAEAAKERLGNWAEKRTEQGNKEFNLDAGLANKLVIQAAHKRLEAQKVHLLSEEKRQLVGRLVEKLSRTEGVRGDLRAERLQSFSRYVRIGGYAVAGSTSFLLTGPLGPLFVVAGAGVGAGTGLGVRALFDKFSISKKAESTAATAKNIRENFSVDQIESLDKNYLPKATSLRNAERTKSITAAAAAAAAGALTGLGMRWGVGIPNTPAASFDVGRNTPSLAEQVFGRSQDAAMESTSDFLGTQPPAGPTGMQTTITEMSPVNAINANPVSDTTLFQPDTLEAPAPEIPPPVEAPLEPAEVSIVEPSIPVPPGIETTPVSIPTSESTAPKLMPTEVDTQMPPTPDVQTPPQEVSTSPVEEIAQQEAAFQAYRVNQAESLQVAVPSYEAEPLQAPQVATEVVPQPESMTETFTIPNNPDNSIWRLLQGRIESIPQLEAMDGIDKVNQEAVLRAVEGELRADRALAEQIFGSKTANHPDLWLSGGQEITSNQLAELNELVERVAAREGYLSGVETTSTYEVTNHIVPTESVSYGSEPVSDPVGSYVSPNEPVTQNTAHSPELGDPSFEEEPPLASTYSEQVKSVNEIASESVPSMVYSPEQMVTSEIVQSPEFVNHVKELSNEAAQLLEVDSTVVADDVIKRISTSPELLSVGQVEQLATTIAQREYILNSILDSTSQSERVAQILREEPISSFASGKLTEDFVAFYSANPHIQDTTNHFFNEFLNSSKLPMHGDTSLTVAQIIEQRLASDVYSLSPDLTQVWARDAGLSFTLKQ